MSNVKASLKVVLFAEQVIVAESEDPQLWQRVLGVIQGGGLAGLGAVPRAALPVEVDEVEEVEAPASTRVEKSAAGKFAADIGVAPEQVEAACAPSTEQPYLILDHDAWAEFKSQLGDRGPWAVSPVVAAATLLALWFKNSNGQTNATQAQAQAVLKGINVRDSNPARGIKRADWLQPRAGGQVIITPTKMAKAKLFARCFCSQDWTQWKGA